MKRRFRTAFISCFVILTLILNAAGLVGVSADVYDYGYIIEEAFSTETLPEKLVISEGSGTVSVKDGMLELSTEIDGTYTMASWNFPAITTGQATVELQFMQKLALHSGNTILGIEDDNKEIAAIVTEGANISVKKSDGTYIPLIENYQLDVLYSLNVALDINSNTYSVMVDGNELVSDMMFNNSSAVKITDVYSCCEMSPGFYIDNVKIGTTQKTGDIIISGAQTQSIPRVGENSYNYEVVLNDMYGNEMENVKFAWKLKNPVNGVSISADEEDLSKGKLVVSSGTAEQTITIQAYVVGNASLIAEKEITLSDAALSEIAISGSAHVSYYKNSAQYQYNAKAYDTDANLMQGETIVWEIENNSSATLEISSDGLLTISGRLPHDDEYAKVRARLASDGSVIGEKKIVVQRWDTYYNDISRLETVKENIDHILKYASNKEGTNPLVAGYLSPYTNQPGEIIYKIGGASKYANLTENWELLRAMTALSNLEGDPTYKERVLDMCQWYYDYGQAGNNLFHWGNHRSFDLESGDVAEYYKLYDTNKYYEVENRDMYDEPFLELDKQRWVDHYKSHWVISTKDWSTLEFNRHSPISSSAPDLTAIKKNLDKFSYVEDEDFPYVPFIGLTFMSTASVLLHEATVIYENDTNREDAKIMLEWGNRLVNQYLNTTNKKTGMFGTMFVSSMFADGVSDLKGTFGEKWWSTEAGIAAGKNYAYGDRAYNQFAEMLRSRGLIREEQMLEILEANLITGDRIFSQFATDVFKLSDVMRNEPDLEQAAQEMAKKCFNGLVSVIDYAYDETTNKFDSLFSNGVVMTGVVWDRPGYWGSAGKSFSQWNISAKGVLGLLDGYLSTQDYPDMADTRNRAWEFVRSYLNKTFLIGDVGNPESGIEPTLNSGTNCSDAGVIRILLKLYDATGEYAYIQASRVIANNIAKKFNGGLFIKDSKLRFVPTECEEAYVLLLLEEKIRKESGLVPESAYPNGYEHQLDNYSIVNNALIEWGNPEILSLSYQDVFVTDIITDMTTLHINQGESVPLNITVLPDDATSKGVFWEIEDKSIVRIDENNNVYALKKGETDIMAVSKSSVGVKSKTIKITVE